MLSRQVKRIKSLQLKFYLVFQPANSSSCLQMFFKIGTLKRFAKFTGKQLCQSLFLIKLQAVRDSNPKEALARVFSCEYSKFLRIAILKIICERLLLYLTDFSEQLVFRENIFQKSCLTYSFPTFISLLFHFIDLFH